MIKKRPTKKIPTDKIREVIGSGGKVIRALVEETGAKIDVEDDGTVSIATADKKFVWAKAYLDGNDVIVYAEQVTQPIAVRYAWANNPVANL